MSIPTALTGGILWGIGAVLFTHPRLDSPKGKRPLTSEVQIVVKHCLHLILCCRLIAICSAVA